MAIAKWIDSPVRDAGINAQHPGSTTYFWGKVYYCAMAHSGNITLFGRGGREGSSFLPPSFLPLHPILSGFLLGSSHTPSGAGGYGADREYRFFFEDPTDFVCFNSFAIWSHYDSSGPGQGLFHPSKFGQVHFGPLPFYNFVWEKFQDLLWFLMNFTLKEEGIFDHPQGVWGFVVGYNTPSGAEGAKTAI